MFQLFRLESSSNALACGVQMPQNWERTLAPSHALSAEKGAWVRQNSDDEYLLCRIQIMNTTLQGRCELRCFQDRLAMEM